VLNNTIYNDAYKHFKYHWSKQNTLLALL
jgi:hypothetical protein